MTTSDPGFGLYIHIPFCVSKCAYCAFSSLAGGGRLIAPYIEALHQEVDRIAHRGAGRSVQSVYFGGGTPSLLAPTVLAGVLEHCRAAFSIASDAEITLEANPETVTEDRVRAYLDAGVNRVSMGVQSLQDQALIELGRPHTAGRAIAAAHAVRRAGCRNINLDLLYGLPGQTLDEWRHTLARTLDLDPDHLSAYALTPEPGTEIGGAVASGAVALPEADVIQQQEAILYNAVERAGFSRYEISNYAKPGRACRHNMLYWRCDDWIGIGASAHSHIAGRRWWNRFDPADYIQAGLGHSTIADTETLTPDQQVNETLAFGLRLVEGVSTRRINQRFGRAAWTAKAREITKLVAQGLVEQDDQAIRLTPRGREHADSVAVSLC